MLYNLINRMLESHYSEEDSNQFFDVYSKDLMLQALQAYQLTATNSLEAEQIERFHLRLIMGDAPLPSGYVFLDYVTPYASEVTILIQEVSTGSLFAVSYDFDSAQWVF